MKTNLKRKGLILLLAVAMVVSLMPTAAFADGENIQLVENLNTLYSYSHETGVVTFNIPEDGRDANGYLYMAYVAPAYLAEGVSYAEIYAAWIDKPVADVTQINMDDPNSVAGIISEAGLFVAYEPFEPYSFNANLSELVANGEGDPEGRYLVQIIKVHEKCISKTYEDGENPYNPQAAATYMYGLYGVCADYITFSNGTESGENPGENPGVDPENPPVPEEPTTTPISSIGAGALVPVDTVLSLTSTDKVVVVGYRDYLLDMKWSGISEYETLCSTLGINDEDYGMTYCVEPDSETSITFAEVLGTYTTDDLWLCYMTLVDGSGKYNYHFVSTDDLGGANSALKFVETAYSIEKGGAAVNVSVNPDTIPYNLPVEYYLVGTYASGTSIDASGNLTCAANETAATIKVLAKAVYGQVAFVTNIDVEVKEAPPIYVPDIPIYIPEPTPTITVPVTGEDNTVHVDAQISGSTATINPIKQEELDHVADGTNTNTNIEIDLTGLGKEINSAAIPKETLEKVATAIDDETNNVDGLTIKLSTATVEIDSTTLAAVIEQADGNEIKLNVDNTDITSLNEVQQGSVKELEVHLQLDAYFTCNGVRIGDFKGGSVVLSIPFEIPEGYNPDGFSVWFVDDNGEKVKYESKYDEVTGELIFTVDHFSDYIIAYDEADVEKAQNQARIDALKDIQLVARSKMSKLSGKKSVRVRWYDKYGADLEAFGFDGFEIYRSESRYSGYGDEPFFVSKTGVYYNTLISKGNKYYYKVRGYIIVDGEKYYTDWSLKAIRTVK